MRILLTRRAVRNFRSIVNHIQSEWGEGAAEVFEQKTINFLDLLADFPEIGTVEFDEKQIRGFLLTRQIRVFYRIKGERIIILDFFDVRQHRRRPH